MPSSLELASGKRYKLACASIKDSNQKSATYTLQRTTISIFAAFSRITNKAWYFMRIICCQTTLIKYHTLFFSKNRKDFAKFVVCCSREISMGIHVALSDQSWMGALWIAMCITLLQGIVKHCRPRSGSSLFAYRKLFQTFDKIEKFTLTILKTELDWFNW